MSRGRKPHTDPPTLVQLSLPQSLVDKMDLLLFDPLRQKPAYGARSQFVAQLIREAFDRMARKDNNVNV